MPHRIEISKRLIEISDEISVINKRILAGEITDDVKERVKKCEALLADLKSLRAESVWPDRIEAAADGTETLY